jgi:hypothetical protein
VRCACAVRSDVQWQRCNVLSKLLILYSQLKLGAVLDFVLTYTIKSDFAHIYIYMHVCMMLQDKTEDELLELVKNAIASGLPSWQQPKELPAAAASTASSSAAPTAAATA